MGISDGNTPPSASASDAWEEWMDVVEQKWLRTMEAARCEYEAMRDAVRAKQLGQDTSPGRSTSARTHTEDSTK